MTDWLAAPLVTPRLVLRPWRPTDAAAIASLKTDPKVREYLGGALSAEKAAATTRSQIAAQTWGHFVLADAYDDTAFGTLTLDRKRGPWEMSFQLSPGRWGQGLMSEAVAAVSAWFFAQSTDEPLIAVTQVANLRTRRLLERVGGTQTREFEEHDANQVEYRLSAASAGVTIG